MSNLKTEHEMEIDQIHDRQLSEKDAEIERLKSDDIRIHAENVKLCALITELCDALEEEFGESRDLMQSQQRPWNLILQGREATK